MEEIHLVFTNLHTGMESQTPHASNMLPITSTHLHAPPSTSARTAPGHHAQLDNLAKTNVGLLNTRNTMPVTTIASVERPRCKPRSTRTDQSPVVSMPLKLFTSTLVVSTLSIFRSQESTTRSLSLDGVLMPRLAKSTGSEETLGELTGVRLDSSEWPWAYMVSELRTTAPLVSHLSPSQLLRSSSSLTDYDR
jgi:hypothetical protein